MIEYGITTSKAHVWVHVCPLDASIYWYSRARMVALLERFQEREIASARGRIVRLFGNRSCDGGIVMNIDRPYPWFNAFKWREAKTDDEVGQIGEAMFAAIVVEHGFPFPLKAVHYDERADQYQGKDFRIEPARVSLDVEVKADFAGGEWGTGNLFVQTHELHHEHGERHAHRRAS